MSGENDQKEKMVDPAGVDNTFISEDTSSKNIFFKLLILLNFLSIFLFFYFLGEPQSVSYYLTHTHHALRDFLALFFLLCPAIVASLIDGNTSKMVKYYFIILVITFPLFIYYAGLLEGFGILIAPAYFLFSFLGMFLLRAIFSYIDTASLSFLRKTFLILKVDLILLIILIVINILDYFN